LAEKFANRENEGLPIRVDVYFFPSEDIKVFLPHRTYSTHSHIDLALLKQQRCDIFVENEVDTCLGLGRKCANRENEGSPKLVHVYFFF